MIYVSLALVGILVIVIRARSRILFIPTAPGEIGKEGEVSTDCTQHYHSFWHWRWKDENGQPYWIPRLEKMTHFWWCTIETCPNDGDGCERPQPHQKWGVGPKIHDQSL